MGVCPGFAKVLPFTKVNFANFVTLYQSTPSFFSYCIYCPLSDPVKRDPIYTRVNALKTIPFPVAHTHIPVIPLGVLNTHLYLYTLNSKKVVAYRNALTLTVEFALIQCCQRALLISENKVIRCILQNWREIASEV